MKKLDVNESSLALSTHAFTWWSSLSKQRQGWRWGGELGQDVAEPWRQDARVGTSEEPSAAQAKVGQPVKVAVGDTFDHSVETQAKKVVSHFALRQIGRLLAEQRCQLLAKIAVGKAGGVSWNNNSALHSAWICGSAKRGGKTRCDSI